MSGEGPIEIAEDKGPETWNHRPVTTDPTANRVVILHGGPAPYREALLARLARAGFAPFDSIDAEAPHDSPGDVVTVEFVDSIAAWEPALSEPTSPPRIAVLRELRVDGYAKALAHGIAPVHLDTSTEIMLAVIEASLRHETLLPAQIARHLGGVLLHGGPPSTARIDVELARLVVDGHTSATIADLLHFSERTIRRRVQALYLTLGVQTRAEAVAVLRNSPELGL